MTVPPRARAVRAANRLRLGQISAIQGAVRLIVDALRLRRARSNSISDREQAFGTPGVVVGVVVGILLAGATNPYLFAAFGLVSMLAMVAWLERPRSPDPT